MDEKNKYRYENLPIPTYEEATSSRPVSAQSRVGPEEISDDAERQGLLRYNPRESRAPGNYEPPSVESARPSIDSLDGIERESEDEVRREMQQMDIEDPNSDNGSHRSLLTYRFSKRFTTLTNSFSSLHLPSFRQFIPSISWPRIDYQALDNNRVVIIGRLFGIFLIVGILYVLIASDVLSFSRSRMNMGQMYDPESIRAYIQNHMNINGDMEASLEHITQFPHMAGTEGSFVLGEWVAELFKSAELEDVSMERFDVYLNYPRKGGRRVAITGPEEKKWEAAIEEIREEDLVFHGHSKSGNVTGPLVYANFGAREDFETLENAGISVKGAVVLVRYYGTQGDRALKVKAAELAGAAGCIIYSDPAQDGFVQGPTFPDGRFRPEDGVQRGAVSLMSWVVGDVLSPGWASTPGDKKRLSVDQTPGLNKIPSIPIAWRDAKHLLEALKGQGQQMPSDWTGAPDTEYWSGDVKSEDSIQVNLMNLQDEEIYQPIYNVLGRLTGWEQPDKKVIVGNHRDAWCTGAADPGSGTAVMLEVVRIFGELRKLGWRPLRTIEFASWDGEEYNLIGSTEHVENREDELRRDGYAYLNVDVGVSGTDFHAAASPLFQRSLLHVLGRTSDPFLNNTIREIWEQNNSDIEGLGAGSDYVAFQDIVGTSSIDMFFKGQPFPYHSCYDNLEWMKQFGDPEFRYHKVMGEIWALLILDMADRPLLPFDLSPYSDAVSKYIDGLHDYLDSQDGSKDVDLSPLQSASETFKNEADTFMQWDQVWESFIYSTGGYESNAISTKRIERNNRLAAFETNLLDLSEGGGLPNRTQFKHVIFAPQLWSGYDEAYFPAIREAIEAKDWASAQKWVQKIADILGNAATKLNEQ